MLLAPLLARVSSLSLHTQPLCVGIHLLSIWFFSPSLLSASTVSTVKGSLVLSTAWLSQFMSYRFSEYKVGCCSCSYHCKNFSLKLRIRSKMNSFFCHVIRPPTRPFSESAYYTGKNRELCQYFFHEVPLSVTTYYYSILLHT